MLIAEKSGAHAESRLDGYELYRKEKEKSDMKITRRSFLAAMGVSTTAALAAMLAGCGGGSADSAAGLSDSEKAAWSTAAAELYGKYPELVTYTTGYNLTNQGADVLKDTPYANDTTEDNAYTRYLKEVLNVQNSNQFEATTGDDYDQKVSMAVASQEIPDAFHVDDYAPSSNWSRATCSKTSRMFTTIWPAIP